MITLNAAKGLGDAIYLRAAVLHLLNTRRDPLVVFTRWREVFSDLPITIKALGEVTGDEHWYHVKPCLHCRMPEIKTMDAFTMACRQAGIDEPVELRMDWKVRNNVLPAKIRKAAAGRQVMLYQPLKKVSNENQALLRPKTEAYDRFISEQADCFRVRIGEPNTVDVSTAPYELDLLGKTTVTDIFDLAISGVDRFVSEPSFTMILAQAIDKPVTTMFSRRALKSSHNFIANFTPERLFNKPQWATAIYDE